MTDDRALRVLIRACHETLDDARAGGTWLRDSLRDLERLCEQLEAELEARAGQ